MFQARSTLGVLEPDHVLAALTRYEDIFVSIPIQIGACIAPVTQAVAATGKMPEAVAWAVDMAQHASSVTGTNVSLLVNAYGDFGGMAFISTVADMGVADASAEALRADADYIAKIGASAGLFVDGSAHQSLLQRLA